MKTQIEAVMASNAQTPPEYQVVCEGLLLGYDPDMAGDHEKWVRIRDYSKVKERVKGDTFATWTVLCERDMLDSEEVVIHPYIVWTLIARPEGWSFSSGEYFADFEEALEAYKARV